MDFQTVLQGYRLKFGLEQSKTSPKDESSFDEFAPIPGQAQGAAPEGFQEPLAQNFYEDSYGITSAPVNVEADQERINAFAEMADKDPILSRKYEQRNEALKALREMVKDPNNAMDEQQALSFIDEMNETLYSDEVVVEEEEV